MATKKSSGAPRREDPIVFDLMRRFNPSGDADGNRALACDPSGIEAVSEDALESVDYERPSFNWPQLSSPLSNYFVIDAMAMDILRKAGFSREAGSLKTRSSFARPDYDDLPTLLHHYLDFAPAQSLSGPEVDEIRAMAERMGLDPTSMLKTKRKNVTNPLAHPNMTLAQEWAWLVEHKDTLNSFGKNAADYLSVRAIVELSQQWLGQINKPLGDPADASFANRAWFDANFPMGWIHLDYLHETAIVSAPLSFPEQMTLLTFELASKTQRGLPEADVIRFGFDHLNTVQINGAAVMGARAFDFLYKALGPALLGETVDLHPSFQGGAALRAQLAHANPALCAISQQEAVWLAYRRVSPLAAQEIETAWRESLASREGFEKLSSDKLAQIHARLEKLTLQQQSLVWSSTPPQIGAAPVPKQQLRV